MRSGFHSDRMIAWAIPALVVVVTAFVYAPWQPREYTGWDDTSYIRDNPHVTTLAGFPRIWTTFEDDQYYPLTFASYWLEFRVWGDWPTGYYLTNVLLHCIATVLVFRLAGRLLALVGPESVPPTAWQVGLAAGLVAGLFALHPTNVASVAWLAQRKNTLSAVLALAAMLFYFNFLQRNRRRLYAAAIICFALALLAKTAVMTIPASLLAAEVLLFRRRFRVALLHSAAFFALAAAAASVTFIREHAGPTYAEPFPMRPFAAAEAIWFYLLKIVWPHPLIAVYPKWPVVAGPAAWVALFTVAISPAVAWFLRDQIDRRVIWGGLHFIITLSPIVGLVSFGFLEQAQVADHYLYLASSGLFLALGVGLQRLLSARVRIRALAAVAAPALLSLCAGLTLPQISLWRTGRALFDATLRLNPGSVVAHQVLGWNALQADDLTATEHHYLQALHGRPNDAALHSDYGMVLVNLGRTEEGLDQLAQSIRLSGRNANAYFNLGAAYGNLGRFDEAATAFRHGLEFAPENARAHLNLAIALGALGDRAGAEGEFETARRLSSSDPLVYAEFAEALAAWGRPGAAREIAQQGLLVARKVHDVKLEFRIRADLERWPR